jgi:hypothetical protein
MSENAMMVPGTGHLRDREDRIAEFADGLQGLGMGQLGGAANVLGYQNRMTNNLMGQMGPQAPEARIRQYRAQSTEEAARMGQQAGLAMRAQGLGDGFQAGTMAGISQDAARQTSQYAAQQRSPEARMGELQALQGLSREQLQTILQLFAAVNGQQMPQLVGNPWGQALGEIAVGAASTAANRWAADRARS